jgi:MFS transporter, DHA1 family, multidrug resistance protein
MNPFKVILLLSYICIASLSAAMITPALPQIQSSFHLNENQSQWMVSIFLLGYVIGQLIYGPLANRFGRLSSLRVGLIINVVGIVLCLVASYFLLNYPVLLLGRLITALGAASGLSCTFILVNELLPEAQAKKALSFVSVSFTVGIGLAVTIGGWVTEYIHWQACFWILLVHGIGMFIFTWQFHETLTKVTPLNPKVLVSKYWIALKSRKLVVFSLFPGLCSTISYCYSAAAPIIAQSTLHFSPSQYGYWNLLNMLGMMSSGFLSSYLMRHYEPRNIVIFAMGLLIPSLASLVAWAFIAPDQAVWFFATTFLLYLLGGLLFTAASFLASNSIQDKASAASMMSFINMAAATLTVIIMGHLSMNIIAAFIAILIGSYLFVVLVSSKYLLTNN